MALQRDRAQYECGRAGAGGARGPAGRHHDRGAAEVVEDEGTKDAFAAKHEWDPRNATGDYVYFRVVPERVQAWREENELAGRTIMRDGEWIVG